jgi:hypothetical protein
LFRQTQFLKPDGTVIKPTETDIPYETIDVIFNGKNMWANFQNPHPNYIFYNLHREKQWRPYIFDKNFNKVTSRKKKQKSADGDSSESDGIFKPVIII